MHLSTVRVKHADFPEGILINESDFDAERHELIEEDGTDRKLTVAEMREQLVERGIAIPEGARKADLRALLADAGNPK